MPVNAGGLSLNFGDNLWICAVGQHTDTGQSFFMDFQNCLSALIYKYLTLTKGNKQHFRSFSQIRLN